MIPLELKSERKYVKEMLLLDDWLHDSSPLVIESW